MILDILAFSLLGLFSISNTVILSDETIDEIPVVQYLMDVDRRGTYVVKEEVEKAVLAMGSSSSTVEYVS